MGRIQANETLVKPAVRHVDGHVSRTVTESASRRDTSECWITQSTGRSTATLKTFEEDCTSQLSMTAVMLLIVLPREELLSHEENHSSLTSRQLRDCCAHCIPYFLACRYSPHDPWSVVCFSHHQLYQNHKPPFSSHLQYVTEPNRMFASTSGCAPASEGKARLIPVGPSRKRARDDGAALTLRTVQSSQPMRTAKAPTRGRRMPSTRGTPVRRHD